MDQEGLKPSYSKDKNGNWVVVPPDIKEEAKKMYMTGAKQFAIADALGISRGTIGTWIRKEKWKDVREIKRIEDAQEFFMRKKADFVDISSKIVDSLKDYANYLVSKPAPMTEKEAKTAIEILDRLDKQTRLDDNKPTDITHSEKPITVIELKEKLKVDPFLEIEDAELEEEENV